MNIIEAFKTCLAKSFDFTGRASRSEFWLFLLAVMILVFFIQFFVGFVAGIINNSFMESVVLFVAILQLAFIPAYLTSTVRRLHDIGRTGWWLIICCVPFIGFIIFIIFTTKRSEEGENEYGPNPYAAQRRRRR